MRHFTGMTGALGGAELPYCPWVAGAPMDSDANLFDSDEKNLKIRRMKSALLYCSLSLALILLIGTVFAEVNKPEKVAGNVYFHEGDLIKSGHCNNGWIIFDDFVLVVD